MGFQQVELYQRIQQFSLDAIDANLPFSHRLARDNGWTLDYAQRVVEEYKKFWLPAVAAQSFRLEATHCHDRHSGVNRWVSAPAHDR